MRTRVLIALGCLLALSPATALAAPPEISVISSLPSGWLSGGSYRVKVAVSNSSDIRSLRVTLPTIEQTKPLMADCVVSACISPSLEVEVRPAALWDGLQQLVVTATDVHAQSSTVRIPVRIDHTAPAPISDAAVDGAEGWRAENHFDVRWPVPPADAGAPVVATRYELCPTTGAGDCLTGRREGPGVSGLDGLAVPASGVWQLRVGLEDEAGNVDLGTALTTLWLDAEPPTFAFLPSPENPARVVADVADSRAGLVGVGIEVRRRGEDTWRPLAVEGSGPFTALLDDDVLPAGIYEVRGRAVDAAGNERSVASWPGGGAVEIGLPVRQGSTMTAGVAAAGAKNKTRTKLDARPLLAFGKSAQVRGTLADEFGHARPAVAVRVRERLVTPGAQWRDVATLATDKAGTFAYRAKAGPARTLRFEYAGSPITRAAAAEVTLRVQARTTLTADRRRLRNGDTVLLRGTLRGDSIPETGKLLTLQARVPGGWRTFGTARARAKDGRWSYRYRFTQTSTTARYTFRVVVPQEVAFPYVSGTSSPLDVVVSGSS